MENLKDQRSAGGEDDSEEDVYTVEIDITDIVRKWLKSKEKDDEGY